jgi:phosphopantetheinyl transferase (holo-ACP synthase)
MIGNDIVDLQKAGLESNWLRRGYLDKLFCRTEQELIFDSTDPDHMVWLLWSMKEACYKIHFRYNEIRCYQPKRIICSNLMINKNCASGQILYENRVYFSRSVINRNFVHTSAVSYYLIFKDLNVFIEDCKEQNNFNDNYQKITSENTLLDYNIIKSHYNIPYLQHRITGEKLPISLSHHGRFLSFIFQSNDSQSQMLYLY